MDAHGAVEFLRKSFTSPKTEMMRTSAVVKFNDESTKVTPIQAGTLTTTNRYDIEVKTCLYYRRSSSTLHTLSSLGITNPLYLSWELMKYSFVIDWFVHVGDFLSSLDAAFGCSFVAGCVTTGVRASQELRWYQSGVTSPGNSIFSDYSEKDENFSVDRSTLLTFPLLTLPAFKDPRSLEHALNAIALLRQSKR